MKQQLMRLEISVLALLTILPIAGCGTNNPSNNVQDNGIQVSISPGSADLAPNQTQQFDATVSNSTNTSITWQVNGVTGGNSTVGIIDSAGLYTAPAAAPNPRGTVVVEAVADADPTKVAGAIVGLGISVTVTPQSPILAPGSDNTQQFHATVFGSSDQQVAWSVNGIPGGSSSVGVIDSTGKYVAPSAISSDPQTFEVEATSAAYQPAVGTSAVTITASAFIIVAPSNPQVIINTTQQFTATVSPSSANQSVTWSLSGQSCPIACGSLDPTTGLYTAPSTVPNPNTVRVTATSTVDPALSGSTTVTITQMMMSISPNNLVVDDLSLSPGSALTLTATINNAPSTPTVSWLLGCINSFETDQTNEEHCEPDNDNDLDGTGGFPFNGGVINTVWTCFVLQRGLYSDCHLYPSNSRQLRLERDRSVCSVQSSGRLCSSAFCKSEFDCNRSSRLSE